jgi:hypothetical protein
LRARVASEDADRLGPWWFRFEIDGGAFGGTAIRDTDKVDAFFEWLGRCDGSASTILELGAHEGSHTLQLAAQPGVDLVLALEGREDNLARARFAQQAYGTSNAEFRLCNLEKFESAGLGSFDAVFCSGLLYHLPEPWTLIGQLASITRWLFLDTHYALSEEVALGPYAGRWQQEGDDPASGLSQFSFWLSFKTLVMLLLEQGFVARFVSDAQTSNGPRTRILAEQVGYGRAGSLWSGG